MPVQSHCLTIELVSLMDSEMTGHRLVIVLPTDLLTAVLPCGRSKGIFCSLDVRRVQKLGMAHFAQPAHMAPFCFVVWSYERHI